jgi:hypothetical protein
VRITVLGYWSIGFLTFDIVTDQEVDHLPDPSTLPGTLDLIAFCFLVILGNVFDFRTYTNAIGDPLEEVDVHDQNGIALEERVNICQARGVCLELLRWWESKYRATNPAATGSSAGVAFTTRLIVAQAATVLRYKRSAEKDNREGALGCTASLLSLQIDNVISIIPGGPLEWARIHNSPTGVDVKLGYNADEWAHTEIIDRELQNFREYDHPEASGVDLTPL